jgi:triosephosphate isomerase
MSQTASPDLLKKSGLAKKLVVANWKMHGNLEKNKALLAQYIADLSGLKQTKIVVCAPYPYLAQLQQLLQHTNISWGAQNIAKNAEGAYTGEVSAAMLKEFGCEYVIIGHSERATAYCESDENIAQKFVQAKQHGLTPILCVGETLIEREAGVMELVIGKQLDTIIAQHGAAIFADSIISYEPIWAIGTGLAATPVQAQAMHKFIRNKIASIDKEAASRLKILYGGSINPQNALQLLVVSNVDGGLVGKCSLEAQSFEKICAAADMAN